MASFAFLKFPENKTMVLLWRKFSKDKTMVLFTRNIINNKYSNL